MSRQDVLNKAQSQDGTAESPPNSKIFSTLRKVLDTNGIVGPKTFGRFWIVEYDKLKPKYYV